MAAYEVLLLNTAIPQIQAAQSGDTYVVPRDIAFSTVANLANGTNLLPSLTFSSDTNTGIYREGADALGFTAGGGTNQMVLTSTGLGIGTTSPAVKLHVSGQSRVADSSNAANYMTFGVGANAPYGNASISTTTAGLAIVAEGAGNITFRNNGSEAMRIDTANNLGLGVTPSAWRSGARAFQLGATGYASLNEQANGSTSLNFNCYESAANTWAYYVTGFAPTRYTQLSGAHAWYNAPSGTANSAVVAGSTSYTVVALGTTTLAQWQASFSGLSAIPTLGQVLTSLSSPVSPIPNGGLVTQNISFTQAMTLDASGNLGVGTTSPGARLDVVGNYARFSENASGAEVYLRGYYASVAAAIQVVNNFPLLFLTNNVERARITSGGYFKASNTGAYTGISSSYHEFYQTADSVALLVRATNGSYTSSVLEINGDRATTNATYNLISAYNGPISGQFIVRDSGNAVNTTGTYGTISDQKLKQDIVDAGSQWADIKAVRFRKFKMKNDSTGLLQLGVVAQELEQTSPGLVEEHTDRDREGNDLGTTTKSVKTSVLLMKAAVALQEAMARIEKLEAEVAALKGA